MDKETQCMVLHIVDALLVQLKISRDLNHSDVLLTAAFRNPQSPKAFFDAVESVSQAGDSLLELDHRLRKLREAIQKN